MAYDKPHTERSETVIGDLQVQDQSPFRLLGEKLNEAEPRYLRARKLLDGPECTAMAVGAELRNMIRTTLEPVQLSPFLDWALASCADLSRAALNAAAWLALEEESWKAAHTLASEVVARDHIDLLAQRLVDAAAEKSRSLELEVDRWLSERSCMAPFSQIETRVGGSVQMCCASYQPVPIGTLDGKTADFWNSERAREIRRSVLDGDYSHCSRWHCPQIAMRRLPKRAAPAPTMKNTADPLTMDKGPDRVILSHDRSCNISCPICRVKLINLPHAQSERLNTMFERQLLPIIRDASWVKVTGSGDPFGSRHFRHVLKQLTKAGPARRRIQLHTNGLLANRRAWDELGLWDNVSSVWVTVDATQADTYSVVRRGGDFTQLYENLHFLGELRRDRKIDSFRLDFVVQQANFREIGDFMDLRREVGADAVYFLRLRNWGHFSSDAFREMDVCAPEHPEHEALLRALSDPRLDTPAAQLGSMSELVAKARARFPTQSE